MERFGNNETKRDTALASAKVSTIETSVIDFAILADRQNPNSVLRNST